MIILGDLIAYRGGVIYIEIELIQLTIEGRLVRMSFDVLPLGKDEVVLGIP